SMDTKTALRTFARDRYAELSSIEIVESAKGYCKARMQIEDKHLNSVDVVHGGALFTLADLAFAVASNSHGQVALAINAHITYLQAAQSGVLYAVATEVDRPRKLGAYEVVISDEQGRTIATFSGMVYRKNQRIKDLD
ncbi:MAG: PaaI family thioesterase, partial [Desulfofustis sp.]|nr:PaaI family thioesterase [Desulfofustis sp.]